jgi:molybdopterin/thiamine biosynthesis adenylyltransferase
VPQTIEPQSHNEYRPLILRLSNFEDRKTFDNLLKSDPHIKQFDTIYSQLTELIRLRNPSERLSPEENENLIAAHLKNISLQEYGTWVYYPWNRSLVHLLDEEEFIEVRTNRNMLKIQPEEIQVLRSKSIGIIGLSVGQSIALTIAMERICSELRLADFDDIELSNMNRIRVGVQDLGMSKVIVAARQIAELDPYIRVKCFERGIQKDSIDEFFKDKDGRLDVLVEECDGLDIKVLSRIYAKKLGIPVVMDTNDRGMLDIERFDLEPERPILHGRVPELEQMSTDELINKLENLSLQEKIYFLSQIIGIENVSDAMKLSLSQMNKMIVGWPQLASAVTLGGAMVTDTCRKILLQQRSDSGRYFVDFDALIAQAGLNHSKEN